MQTSSLGSAHGFICLFRKGFPVCVIGCRAKHNAESKHSEVCRDVHRILVPTVVHVASSVDLERDVCSWYFAVYVALKEESKELHRASG